MERRRVYPSYHSARQYIVDTLVDGEQSGAGEGRSFLSDVGKAYVRSFPPQGSDVTNPPTSSRRATHISSNLTGTSLGSEPGECLRDTLTLVKTLEHSPEHEILCDFTLAENRPECSRAAFHSTFRHALANFPKHFPSGESLPPF
ncbi:hypothetical protein DPX16_20039 [Anabarilius grahami]|uniref:Uncharacterized protein n=1 Tax=Anabarilius grahami TaxID=495550 RepID=A0A3N0XQK3_ANAGA|nr:hypothetical protein DPX16_20039 [Anabarilius grahami]